jgi:G3E family GTPase
MPATDISLSQHRADDGRLRVTLLTGFLGSGKTTLLAELMKQPDMAGTFVIINEFGEVGLDHHLVGTIDETIMVLDSGCLCCAMQGDLIKTLKQVHERLSKREIPPIARILIETTGLADPVPVIYTLMEDRFIAARYVCDGVLTVVDVTHGLEQLDKHPEAVRQVAVADRLLLSKCDLADGATRARIEDELGLLNPSAPRLEVRLGRIAPGLLFAGGIYSASHHQPDVAAWLNEVAVSHQLERVRRTGRIAQITADDSGQQIATSEVPPNEADNRRSRKHTDSVFSFVVTFDRVVPWRGFAAVMGQVLHTYGSRLLRVKGLIGIRGNSAPLVVHCVQDVAYPVVQLASWPKSGPFSDRRGRLVFITDGLSTREAVGIREALGQLPADAAALRSIASSSQSPTRCWLSMNIPFAPSDSFELDGWIVQHKRYRAGPETTKFRTR